MSFLRSLLFMVAVLVMTPPFILCLLLVSWLPKRTLRALSMIWVHGALWMVHHVLGIRYRVLGAENIPQKPCVILSKHQSAWETLALQDIFPWTSFVLKRELHWLPFLGWGFAVMPFIAIDRSSAKEALAQVERKGRQRLDEGYSVVVFPEGTRVAPGDKRRYKIGGAHLAAKTGAPVVPVAHDAGEFWRRQAFVKVPGTVTVSIGPAIDPEGLSAQDINLRAEAWIENEMRRISPHRYADQAA